MTDPAADLHPSTLRASDREREAAVARLRAATGDGRLTFDEFAERAGRAWEARTCGELVLLTEDLPSAEIDTSAVRPPSTNRRRRTVKARRQRLVSIFGGTRHAGGWTAEPEMTVVAVCGHSELDLTTCRLERRVDVIDVRTVGLFAGIELIVPPGAVVDAAGFVLFGGRQLRHEGSTSSTAPVLRVRVRSYGAFGGLLVRCHRRVP